MELGSSCFWTSVANVTKPAPRVQQLVGVLRSLVGIGMLTLPRAVAEAASPSLVTWPGPGLYIFPCFLWCKVTLSEAILGLFLCGLLSAISFFFLGYCAHVTGTETLPHLWEETVGPESAFFVEGVVPFGRVSTFKSLPRLVDTGLSCVAFALLIGDYMAKSEP